MTRIPGLAERLQALVLDGVIIVIVMFITTYAFEKLGDVEDTPRMYVFVFLFFIYDPLLSAMGGTLGHRAMGLRVRQEKHPEKNINIIAAFFRFGIKAILGWLSFLSVSVNSKGKALHDFAVGSIIVYKTPPHNSTEDTEKSDLV